MEGIATGAAPDGRNQADLMCVLGSQVEIATHIKHKLDITIPVHLEWNAECSGDFAAS